MTRADTLKELRAFQAEFAEYEGILSAGWRASPGEGWFSAIPSAKQKRVEELRLDLARQYGRLRPALAEPHGGIPMLGSNYAGTAGEIFSVALREPSDNPWLGSALDG